MAELAETHGTPACDGPLDAGHASQGRRPWRAANYLSVGQRYLFDNLLLKKPLKKEHVKPLRP